MMHSGTIVDATLITAPSSTKNKDGKRDLEMHQIKKGSQWYHGMKSHSDVYAGSGYVHTITGTAANVHDIDETLKLIHTDDEVVYGDSGYSGVDKRGDTLNDEHMSKVDFRINRRHPASRFPISTRGSTGKSR